MQFPNCQSVTQYELQYFSVCFKRKRNKKSNKNQRHLKRILNRKCFGCRTNVFRKICVIFRISAVDSFLNPGVFVVSNKQKSGFALFLNPQIPGVVPRSSATPAIYSAASTRFSQENRSEIGSCISITLCESQC